MSKRSRNDDVESPEEYRGERLQRVLAARGVASRRASEEYITGGRVQVNGQTVTELGTRVDPMHDEIRVDGKVLKRQRPRFLMLNKPSSFITTVSDEKQRWTVMDLVQVPERVYPVGRLDRETQGLLLMTNDGDVANRVMHPKYELAKEYHVITSKKPNDRQLQRIRDGIEIEGRTITPDECRILRETHEGVIVKIVLHEGLYHVVRQIMETVGIVVDKLRRVRIGPLTITGIPPGAWRDLTPGELTELYAALGLDPMAAEQMNAKRPMQVTPTGGFAHAPQQAQSGAKSRNAGGSAPGAGRPAARPGSSGAPRRDDSHTRSGRKTNASRPSQGDRNRRPGRGR
ncbi:MAG TPA: pseudouridine synthase [Thermomicrobiales bacterium]|nr:pseudouridine synthase [Thermomicrobiales bacterium]